MKENWPRRLRIKPGCQIAGILKDKLLTSGLYVESTNIDSETFDRLLSDEFKHAVEQLPAQPPEEPLAEVRDAPQESDGDKYRRKLREAEERKYRDRWPAGRPTQYSVD